MKSRLVFDIALESRLVFDKVSRRPRKHPGRTVSLQLLLLMADPGNLSVEVFCRVGDNENPLGLLASVEVDVRAGDVIGDDIPKLGPFDHFGPSYQSLVFSKVTEAELSPILNARHKWRKLRRLQCGSGCMFAAPSC